MKKIVIGLVVIAVLALFMGAVVKNSNDKSKVPTMEAMDMSSSSSDTKNAVATDQVNIDGFKFSPASITVKKGTKVTWTNQDSVAHTVQETDGKPGPKSGNLKNGSSYSFTFNEAGTFKYFCSIHPDMKGVVLVTE